MKQNRNKCQHPQSVSFTIQITSQQIHNILKCECYIEFGIHWAFGATFSFHAKQLSNNIHTAHQQLPSATHVCATTRQGGDKVGGKKLIFPSKKRSPNHLYFLFNVVYKFLKISSRPFLLEISHLFSSNNITESQKGLFRPNVWMRILNHIFGYDEIVVKPG
jgi:hypothetical protein